MVKDKDNKILLNRSIKSSYKFLIYSGIIRKNISNPDCYGADNPVTTSDESSDAMRIFAASPPDNYVRALHMFSWIL